VLALLLTRAVFQRERSLTPHGAFSILVVEDNVLNQKVLVRILQQLGYSADVAADGRQAIEMAAKHSYDLILMVCSLVLIAFTTSDSLPTRTLPCQ
jgi:PleD family two-component response regulator